jgi:hypothetical protein
MGGSWTHVGISREGAATSRWVFVSTWTGRIQDRGLAGQQQRGVEGWQGSVQGLTGLKGLSLA